MTDFNQLIETSGNENDIFDFVVNAFVDGAVPTNKEEFKKCFSNETTDGSICFANKFGKAENDVAMLFFYPTMCMIPPKYQKNMRDRCEVKMTLLQLDYQAMIAKYIEDPRRLNEIYEDAERRYLFARKECSETIGRYGLSALFGRSSESKRKQVETKMKMNISALDKRFVNLSNYIAEKIESLESETETE